MKFISGNDGRRSARKTIVFLFILYVASNHVVRVMGGGASSSDSLAAGAVTDNVLSSLNDFREATGDVVRTCADYCPKSIQPTCESTFEMCAVVLGLGK